MPTPIRRSVLAAIATLVIAMPTAAASAPQSADDLYRIRDMWVGTHSETHYGTFSNISWSDDQSSSEQQPLRPPNGTYEYAMVDSGSTIFKSTIVIAGSGSTFTISETTKLPNGPLATTKTTWSRDSMLPLAFELHQGTIALRAHITSGALKLDGSHIAFDRIAGTMWVLPSVGLITTTLMYPYVIAAHPAKSFTLAEIQNNQTVLIRPDNASPPTGGPAGDIASTIIKNEEHDGNDRERIVVWVNGSSGAMDEAQASPGTAKITLLSFRPVK